MLGGHKGVLHSYREFVAASRAIAHSAAPARRAGPPTQRACAQGGPAEARDGRPGAPRPGRGGAARGPGGRAAGGDAAAAAPNRRAAGARASRGAPATCAAGSAPRFAEAACRRRLTCGSAPLCLPVGEHLARSPLPALRQERALRSPWRGIGSVPVLLPGFCAASSWQAAAAGVRGGAGGRMGGRGGRAVRARGGRGGTCRGGGCAASRMVCRLGRHFGPLWATLGNQPCRSRSGSHPCLSRSACPALLVI